MIASQNTDDKAKRFTESFDLYYSLMFSVIVSKITNVDEAQDLCQELFSRFFQKFDEIENHRAWLFGAMRILLIDYYKTRGTAPETIDAILDDQSTGYVNGFRDARIIIKDILSEPESFGSATDRVIFELVAVHCYSIADAGRHCGITYRQARYSFIQSAKRIIDLLRSKGIAKLEDLL